MEKQPKFSEAVCRKLDHYVYRLIDPRDGTTFYVGRGRGNRVFQHAAGERIHDEADTIELKLRQIRAIRNAGFEVAHVIHRHGMTEEAAREVESALLDAYPGLTNIQGGYGNDRGVMHAQQVIEVMEAPEAVFRHKLMLININRYKEDQSIYDAVRYSWKISPNKAKKCEYVLAVKAGLIIGAFAPEEWLPATPENFPGFPTSQGRYGFRGHPAPKEVETLYCRKRVPSGYRRRGAANPIRYQLERTSTVSGRDLEH